MQSFFVLLYRYFKNHRIVFFVMVLAGGIVSAIMASRITLEEDISKSMPGENDRINLIINNSKLTNKIILNIFLSDTTAGAQPDSLIEFTDELTDSLRNPDFTPFIDQTALRISDSLVENMMGFFYEHVPIFLDEIDYKKIDSLLLPETIDLTLEKNYKTLISPTSFALKKYILLDPTGISSLALNKLKLFQIEEGYGVQGGYVFTGDKKNLMVFIDPANPPSETLKNAAFLRKLDKLISTLSLKHRGLIKAEYYGASAVAVGNAQQVKKDIALTVTISLLIILLFVGWFFRNPYIPFISFLPAVFGGITALFIIYFLKSKMSTIALGIGSVLLGIIVDYALYVYGLYKSKGSVEEVIKDIGISIGMCSVTTATAFFSMLFVKSAVLRDLGLFAGLSVLGAALFSLVILPHLIRLKSVPDKTVSSNPVDKIVRHKFESNQVLVIAILVISVVLYFFSGKVAFEKDMYSMNFLSKKMKAAEKNLFKISDISLKSVYVASTGKDLDQALAKNAIATETLNKLRNENIVKKYTDVGIILVNDSIQKERIKRWKDYWSEDRRRQLENTMIRSGQKLGFRPDAFSDFYKFIARDIQPVSIQKFDRVRSLFLNDMITETHDFTMVLSLVKVNDEDRHKVFTAFAGNNNTIVIDRQEITSGFVKDIKTDFDLLVKLCLILVSLIVIIAYGRLETGIIASIPMYISWIWTLGFMGLFGIKFNIINIIVTTFIFGLGVDYSILMMRGLSLEYKFGHKDLTSFKTSVFLSAFTTVVGVGVLMLAKHPSLNSIALISVFGLLAVVLISYTIVPIMFRWLISKKGQKRLLPITLSDILITIFVFTLALTASLSLNLLFLLLKVLPLKTKAKKLLLHRGIVFWSGITVYTMLHVKKNIVNPQHEDFRKPAMIISNHQSHIDLLLLMMLYPRMIVLTTRWVWNNPIYALVIRYLDFYPVMEGYGDVTARLRAKILDGYSVVVFPEGSRSPDSSVKRFHKGAFLMAHELGLDLLPVMIHGAGDCMNKGENHLRGGSITVKIFPRVKPGDKLYGSDYHEMTKSMLGFYRTEYARMKEEIETPAYFRRKLIRNYIYKGPVLEWYTRIKLSLEHNYELINSLVPLNASVVDIGCGYGFLSYMLSFVSSERRILGIDYDRDKIDLANNCLSKSSKTEFVTGDAAEYAFEKTDVFVLSDVLHYLSDEKQDRLLENCMKCLNAEGKIIIRDADSDLTTRHWGTRYTEYFSTHSGFNKAKDNRLFFFSGKKIRQMAKKNGFVVEETDKTRLTSNILFVLKKEKVLFEKLPGIAGIK